MAVDQRSVGAVSYVKKPTSQKMPCLEGGCGREKGTKNRHYNNTIKAFRSAICELCLPGKFLKAFCECECGADVFKCFHV